MTPRVTEPPRESCNTVPVDHAVSDEPHRPARRCRPWCPIPASQARRRAAPLAGAKTGVLCGRRRRIEADVGPLGRRGRTTGPAVDPRGGNSDVEPSVEADVAAPYGAIAMFELLQHDDIVASDRRDYWRKSDIGIFGVGPVAKSDVWVLCLPGVRARRPVEDSRSLHVFRRGRSPHSSHRRNGLVLLAQADDAQVDAAHERGRS